MNISVVTVGRSAGALVSGLESLHGPIAVVRHCAELVELLAVCQSGLAKVAIVSAGIDELTASVLDRLWHHDVAVLVLTDDGEQLLRMESLGVPAASGTIDAKRLAAQIVELVAAAGATPRAVGSRGTGLGYADASAPERNGPEILGQGARPSNAAQMPGAVGLPSAVGLSSAAGVSAAGLLSGPKLAGPHSEHRVLAVWGPIGSPGKTTVAVNLAAESAASGRSVLLIDADTYGPSVAAALGLLDESAGIAQACRYAEQGALQEANLVKSSSEVVIGGGSFRVLTGLTRADRWPELRNSALRQVLNLARELFQTTVIDCSSAVEADEEISFDTMAPRRNGVTLLALAEADEVLALGAADSIGVPRLLRALDEVLTTVPAERITVVLNKVRSGAVGRRPESALRQAWERFGPKLPIGHFLPWDPDAADRALLAGQVLKEAAADSALRRGIATIIGANAQQFSGSTVTSDTARRTVSR